MAYDRLMDVKAQQRKRLAATIEWAHKIRTTRQSLLDDHEVHFRQSFTGMAIVGLLPKRPSDGREGFFIRESSGCGLWTEPATD
jgi:hypothetical protein